MGTRQTTRSDVAKGLSRSLRRSLKELPGSLATERERLKRARHEEPARDMRVEDPEQGPDRDVIEGTGASCSRDGAGNDQESMGRPVAMLVTGGDPESRLGGERETKRVRINVFDGEERDEWVETEEEWVRTVVPDEICSLPTTLRVDLR